MEVLMQNIFDSHAHYDDPRFDEDRDTLLSSMASHGVRSSPISGAIMPN